MCGLLSSIGLKSLKAQFGTEKRYTLAFCFYKHALPSEVFCLYSPVFVQVFIYEKWKVTILTISYEFSKF